MHRAVGVDMGRNMRRGMGPMSMSKAMVIVAVLAGFGFRGWDERSLKGKCHRGRHHDDGSKAAKWVLHGTAQPGTFQASQANDGEATSNSPRPSIPRRPTSEMITEADLRLVPLEID